MRAGKIRVLLVLAAVATSAVLLVALLRGPAAALRVLLLDPTEYSKGFDEEKWAKVIIGMDEDALVRLLGAPLETTEVGKGRIYRLLHEKYNECYPDLLPAQYRSENIEYRLLSYSRPGKWIDSYFVRAVKIDRLDHVVEIQGGFYWD